MKEFVLLVAIVIILAAVCIPLAIWDISRHPGARRNVHKPQVVRIGKFMYRFP